jgi:hypothetical protein
VGLGYFSGGRLSIKGADRFCGLPVTSTSYFFECSTPFGIIDKHLWDDLREKLFLETRLKLTVNQDKSAVDRPWKRICLGCGMTHHRIPRLKTGEKALDRLKSTIREISCKGRGRNLKRVAKEITPILRGWSNFFKLSDVK